MRSLRSSRLVLSATSGLGLAGTRRRGGAGGIGACCSPGPWRMKPPGPIERYWISCALRARMLLGAPELRWRPAAGVGAALALRPWRAAGFGAAAAGARLLRFLLLARLHRRGALLEAQAVRLADHGVAADPAELVGDLAGGGAIVPHLLQALDALFSPGHLLNLSLQTLPGRSPADRRHPSERPVEQRPSQQLGALRTGQSGAEGRQLGRP